MRQAVNIFLLVLLFNPYIKGVSPEVNSKFINKTSKKIIKFSAVREKEMQKYLKQFERRQEKLFYKLCRIDPDKADALNASWSASKQRLKTTLNSDKKNFFKPTCEYSPYTDSLLTTLNYFCDENTKVITDNYKNQLSNEQVVKEYMRDQKSIMKNLVSQNTSINKYFKNIAKN